MSEEKREVLILDELSDSLINLFDLVDREGFDTTGVSSQKEALSCVARRKPDVFIDHLRTCGVDDMGFLKKARQLSPRTRIILLSSSSPKVVGQGQTTFEDHFEWLSEACQESKLLELLERAAPAGK